MFNSKDPALDAAIAVLVIITAIVLFTFAAILVVPLLAGWGGWKLYQHLKPIPVYIPAPEPPPEPFTLTDTHLREHVAIFAPSGWGKTQFLENHILHLMARPRPPALFILDSQGNEESPDGTEHPMLYKLERLDQLLSRPLAQTYIIDPKDTPALNFFSFGDPNSAEVNDLFGYLFSSLELEVSAQQANVIRWLMRLMTVIPDPTIKTFLEVIESDKPHPAIRQLDETAQNFFFNQFYKKGSMQLTRTAIANRCYAILANPHLEAMFSASENKFDAARIMQSGAWCFISTSTRYLGESTSSLFGRFFIAQILSACYSLGMTNRLRAVLVLDEAFEYFDKKTERILSQARKYGLGLTFATQNLNQMDNDLRKSVFGNTAVKIAGRVAHDDANALAKEMEIDSQVIRALTKDRKGTTFAVAASGIKPTLLSVPFGTLDQMPMMTEEEHVAFRELNKERLSATTHHSQHTEERRDTPQPSAAPSVTPDQAPMPFDTDH